MSLPKDIVYNIIEFWIEKPYKPWYHKSDTYWSNKYLLRYCWENYGIENADFNNLCMNQHPLISKILDELVLKKIISVDDIYDDIILNPSAQTFIEKYELDYLKHEVTDSRGRTVYAADPVVFDAYEDYINEEFDEIVGTHEDLPHLIHYFESIIYNTSYLQDSGEEIYRENGIPYNPDDDLTHYDPRLITDMYYHINFELLSENPESVGIFTKYPEKVYWEPFSALPEGIKLIEENLEKAYWPNLCLNSAAMHLIEKYPENIVKKNLCLNTAAIPFLRKHHELIVPKYISQNPAAGEFLEEHPKFISWYWISGNPGALKILKKNKKLIDRGRFLHSDVEKHEIDINKFNKLKETLCRIIDLIYVFTAKGKL